MQSKLKLRTVPKQAIQVNKTIVFISFFLVSFVVLVAIINAFSVSKKSVTDESSSIKVAVDKSTESNSELEDLPDNYSDVKRIKKYSFGGQDDEMRKLQSQIDELKNAYALLESKKHGEINKNPLSDVVDSKTQAARSSSLVFSGLSTGVDNLVGREVGRDKKPEEASEVTNNDNAKVGNVLSSQKPATSNYTIFSGTVIPAILVSGIDTMIPGTVIAQVSKDIYDSASGKYLLIPKGSKVLGEYESRGIKYGQDRISVAFDRIIRPDHVSVVLDKPIAYDLQGRAGLISKVDNHWRQVLTSALLSTALSVGAAVAGGSSNTMNLSTWNKSFSGISDGVSGVGQALTSRAMSVPPTITVEPGYQFNLILKKDVLLTLYRGIQ